MKTIHKIVLSVFSHQDEDLSKIRNSFSVFLPFDMEKEKLVITEKISTGFNEKKITVFSLELDKQKHVKDFISNMLNRLTKKQKEALLAQKESRLDNKLNFYIRFDKKKLLEKNKLELIDSGDCYHIRMLLAVFPKKKPKALEIIEKIFKSE